MANTISALKRTRQTKRKTDVNIQRKTRLRHQLRGFRKLMEAKDVKAVTAGLPNAFSAIDKAAKLGIIKENTAARYKSRLAHGLKAIASA